MTTSALDQTLNDGDRDTPDTIGTGRPFAWLLVICGALGTLAAFVITIDKFKLLEDPNFVPGCSLNPIISCGNIMKSEQAHAFGFPNPMIGLIAYPIVVCIGMGLLAGARYRGWFWLGLQAGTLFGAGFVTWLQYQSLYSINSLCLWCCLAWVVTIALFWYTAVHNIKHGIIPVPAAVRTAVLEFHWVVPVLWYGIIAMLILTRWWSYWSTLI
ncbi:vitamin K epoxide reductase family protein [Streptomyces sp. H10-C2]|uniref:vitamin K epoxide reductase family protein n=1 Tax=unclassified Streptomyces TaxID=2593676 RepID=UPI0024BB6AA2|nr:MULTISPECIES: vitamin K epoxide reductase family protein [unclassified Streptomyces]MDJ0345282.1 vitamin K epoxide reductase family protein [Streptomyces sp. PH10-H1]MDJ0370733.1 vitamin K epoxide reductase family protein [Streptomyces sp. H10-C2]